ncbi:TadE-like protein [Pararobbsia alpina]|uniref:TadE/TadG family type IV pilus assembly protein n=1 Tax=Pararobbsia alpina TaxID=621374 RepID=UPI0039A403BF
MKIQFRSSASSTPGPKRLRGVQRIRAGLRRLKHSDSGVAVIEFVVIAPMMLFILLGFSEMYLYMRAVSTVERTAFGLANMLGQVPNLINNNGTASAFDLGTFWNASVLIAAPLDMTTQGGIVLTSVCDSSTSCKAGMSTVGTVRGTPSIGWQQSAPWMQASMTTRETNGGLLPAVWPFYKGDSVLIVEVFYKFTPFAMTSVFWANAPGTKTIYERVYVRPRSGNPINLAAAQ